MYSTSAQIKVNVNGDNDDDMHKMIYSQDNFSK